MDELESASPSPAPPSQNALVSHPFPDDARENAGLDFPIDREHIYQNGNYFKAEQIRYRRTHTRQLKAVPEYQRSLTMVSTLNIPRTMENVPVFGSAVTGTSRARRTMRRWSTLPTTLLHTYSKPIPSASKTVCFRTPIPTAHATHGSPGRRISAHDVLYSLAGR